MRGRGHGFTLPPRTSVEMIGHGVLQPGEPDIPLEMGPPIAFSCIDCDYKTKDGQLMETHQERQDREHTWWQRFRRWRSIRAGPKEYIGRRRK